MLILKNAIVTVALLFASLFQFAHAQDVKQVAITSIVEHPSLDNIRRGVQDELIAQGYTLNKDLVVQYRSAQGSSATAAQIAKQFAANKPDVIVAIATPSAQAVAAATKTIPLVFAAITDPIAAKLIKDWEPTGTNITGVSDMLPLEPQIELMLKIRPNLKTVGYVYSPGEINSTTVLRRLQDALAKHNITVLAVPAQRTSDVVSAARSLRGKVELIYTTTDNNVVSAYAALVKFAAESKIPLIASDPDSVERGAVAALGISYYDFGRQTGQVVAKILKGEKPGDIMPTISNNTTLILNPAAAQQQGVVLSEALLQSAAHIVEKK